MRSDRKAWEAWNWVKENADRFEKPVLGPICLELSVNDKESANMVDKALSKQDKFSFIVQTDKDYSKINEIAHASGDGHPIKQATFLRHTSSNIPAEDLQGISAAKKAEYGIEGALINRSLQPFDPTWNCLHILTKIWNDGWGRRVDKSVLCVAGCKRRIRSKAGCVSRNSGTGGRQEPKRQVRRWTP